MSLTAITGVYAIEESQMTDTLIEEKADVTGNGTEDIIRLKGVKLEGEDDFYKKLTVEVTADQSKPISFKLKEGAKPSLYFSDLNNDGLQDLFVSIPTDSNNGFVQHNLLTVKDGKITELSVPNPLLISSRFKNEYKAEMTIEATGKKYEYDLKDRKKDYDRIGFYQEGKLNEPTELIIDPFGNFQPIQLNGKNALRGTQTISGAYRSDKIATAISTWSYENGNWTLVEAIVEQSNKAN